MRLGVNCCGISWKFISRHHASWAIWTYKDIGLQGVVYANQDSAWLRRIRPMLEKKGPAWCRCLGIA
jgi:hypothetical protein